MTHVGGKVAYSADHLPVSAKGYSLDDPELQKLLKDHVAPALRDDDGVADINELLTGVVDTDFKSETLNKVLQSREPPLDWQVGEAIAETHLAASGNCTFPWPTSRDLRDLKASLPGSDLVGFQSTNDLARPVRFAFGEIKTSTDAKTPPGVMYGRHGLKQQMEDLRDNAVTRHTLFLYLAHRAKNAPWAITFQQAASRYLADTSDVALFGILVRDTKPHADDLRARAKSLADGCPVTTSIVLVALYLPLKTIERLVTLVDKINSEARHANN